MSKFINSICCAVFDLSPYQYNFRILKMFWFIGGKNHKYDKEYTSNSVLKETKLQMKYQASIPMTALK